MRTIGIFGGTFDPVHAAHLALARRAIEVLHLDLVLWVPARPWQKAGQCISEDQHRLSMLEIALADEPLMQVCTIELESERPSYAIESMTQLAQRYPNDRLVLMIGSDQWRNFHTWVKWQTLLERVEIAVFSRNAESIEADETVENVLQEHHLKVKFLDMPAWPISSSEIRAIISQEGPRFDKLSPVLTDGVLRYIDAHKLYQK